MPLHERHDDAYGGTVLALAGPEPLAALPAALREALPAALVAAYEDPAARLNDAAAAVALPGFAAFCAALAARPAVLEIAYDSFAHDDEARLVFGAALAEAPLAASPPAADEAAGAALPVAALDADAPAPTALPGFDLAALEQAMPEGALTPEMRAQVEALGAKMQRALAPRPADVAADAGTAALSFAPPDTLDAPALVRAIYAAVGTIRLGPPGASAGLVAAQPADYRLDAADPDYLAVFESDTGDVLATTEDGSEAVWLRADDAGETPVPAGTLAGALDALFFALAEGRMPAPPSRPDAS